VRIAGWHEEEELWKQAWGFCSRNECEAAIGALEQRVRATADPEAHFQLGLCYAGACRSHSLVDLETACAHFRQALATLPPQKHAERAATLGALGNVYQDATRLPRRERLLAAIECHERAAAIYAELERPDDWAREEHNLGNAFSDLPEQEFPRKWQEAIAHYEHALRVRTRERSPRRHAATLLNLGAAYRELTDGNRSENIRLAIGCYRRALGACTMQDFPEENASLHNSLGNAYLTLAEVEPGCAARAAARALTHFDLALRVCTRERQPCKFAVTQLYRAEAFLAMLETDPAGCLEKAAAAFRDAEQSFALCGLKDYAGQACARRAQIEAARASLTRPNASPEPARPSEKKPEEKEES
jgi:tetratricopeptide (TPR) repeat protein